MTTSRFIAMDDGVRLRSWESGVASRERLAVVMLHGGPGTPDYLAPVAAMIGDIARVHRFDQRGTGGSPWDGHHTIAREVRDFACLLDAWGYERAVFVGHSFGTDLASFFLLAHPERVAGIVYLSGPFLGSWREPTRRNHRARLSSAQQDRLELLSELSARTEDQEIEFLTLSWMTDHADRARAEGWARESARSQRPVNYTMNTELNADKRVEPLEDAVDRLRDLLPSRSMVIGGAGDPRPAAFLREFGRRMGCEVAIIRGAGHDPWNEKPDRFRTLFRGAVRRLVSAPEAGA